MERIRLHKHLLVISLVVAAALVSTTCDNPVDLLEEVQVEVMKANDRYLEVVSVQALSKLLDQTVSPSSWIDVVFDRSIDPAVLISNVEVKTSSGDLATLVFDEGAPINTLRFRPSPYYLNNTDYEMTITNAVAQDGRILLDPITWGFRTGIAPAGYLSLATKDVGAQAGWARTTTVATTISVNAITDEYILANSSAELDLPSVESDSRWTSKLTTLTPDHDLVSTTQGTRTVYARFRQFVSSSYVYSEIISATITFDSVPPAINAGADFYANSYKTLTPAVTETNPHSYAWTTDSGTYVVYGSAASKDTTVNVSPSSDGEKTLRLTVVDKAGNQGFDTVKMTWDKTVPVVNAGADVFTNGIINRTGLVTELNQQSYAWSVISGTALTISSPASLSTDISSTSDGQRTIRLTVTDKAGNTGYDDLIYTKDTVLPVVNIGADVFTNTSRTLTSTVTEPNIQSFNWTVASGNSVTFGTATASTTTASTTDDGARTIRLTVADKAGNSGYDDLIFTWDSTPPLAPSVSVSETPTLDTAPDWNWTTGGGGGGAYYRYQMDSQTGTWINTTATTYTPGSSLSDGLHTLYVQQKDATYEYYSTSGSRQVRITPVIPYDGQSSVSLTPTLRWRGVIGATAYALQFYNSSTRVWSNFVTGLASTSYTITTALPTMTTIVWRVAASAKIGVTYIPSTSGASFITAK
jgi:hypothetical protein